MSIFKMKQYVEVDYRELEKLLIKRFPELKDEDGEFNIVAEQQWNNDSHEIFEVNPLTDADRDAKQFYSGAYDWTRYKNREWHYIPLNYLLSILAEEGEIPFGTLLVNVCW